MGWKVGFLVLSGVFVVVSAAICALILGSLGNTYAATAPPVVATPVGRFVGVVTISANYGGSYVAYRSIPFAKPPIGPLRFRRPEAVDNVSPHSVSNSDTYKPSCWSVTKRSTDPNYGEDCLYLNIYLPGAESVPNSDADLPVMIWIHGGGFVAGSSFPEPEKLVVRGNVIVVTINYRLGVFGFLTTHDRELPGNNGLWDQYMAIKWVKENIPFFGGDSTSITIFGESAGATSAALLAISPVSSDLFQKAILQSGAASGLLSRDARQRTQEFSAMTGCSNYSSSSGLAQCLRALTVSDILQFSKPSAFKISPAQKQIDFIWMPVIDGEFIPDEPLKLLNNISYLEKIGAFSKDFIIGVLNDEGGLVTENFLNTIPLSQLSDTTFVENLVDYLLYERYGSTILKVDDIKEAVYEFYTGSSVSSPTLQPLSVLDIAADVIFVVPAIEMALSLARCHKSDAPVCAADHSGTLVNCSTTTSRVYFYHFNYCPSFTPCTAPCMVHGDDVAYEFPRSIFPDADQQQLSDTFVDILTTFARTSDPGTVVKAGWPVYESITQSYLSIDVRPSVRQYLYNYRATFWLKQIPHLIQHKK